MKRRVRVERGLGWELRCGDWRDVLDDVAHVDVLLGDPPFSRRTHHGQRTGGKDPRYTTDRGCAALASAGLEYSEWTDHHVREYVASWSPRVSGWLAALTSHDLVPAWEHAALEAGRYPFAPIACTQHARNVRLTGDGPSSWSDHLLAARPRSVEWLRERRRRRRLAGLPCALPGAYYGPSFDTGENALDRSARAVRGAKPLWLMRSLVVDYSEPGDLIVDPTAGGGTTLVAAVLEGRRAIGAERDASTWKKAVARLRAVDERRAA